MRVCDRATHGGWISNTLFSISRRAHVVVFVFWETPTSTLDDQTRRALFLLVTTPIPAEWDVEEPRTLRADSESRLPFSASEALLLFSRPRHHNGRLPVKAIRGRRAPQLKVTRPIFLPRRQGAGIQKGQGCLGPVEARP